MLQTERLGQHLAKEGIFFSHIFTSDLQRAHKTALAVSIAAEERFVYPGKGLEVIKTPLIREQDFGALEGQSLASFPWRLRSTASKHQDNASDKASTKADELAEFPTVSEGKQVILDYPSQAEPYASMVARVEIFLDEYIMALILQPPEEDDMSKLRKIYEKDTTDVAIVAHGIILSVLFVRLLARIPPNAVSASPVAIEKGFVPGRGIKSANTAYMVVKITTTPTESAQGLEWPSKNVALKAHVETVNEHSHLDNLKRTRGGIGSSEFDPKQTKLDGFIQK